MRGRLLPAPLARGVQINSPFHPPRGGGGVGTRPWWLALLACGGAYWPVTLEPSAVTSRHPHCRGGGGILALAESGFSGAVPLLSWQSDAGPREAATWAAPLSLRRPKKHSAGAGLKAPGKAPGKRSKDKWGKMGEAGGNVGCVGEPNGKMVQSWRHPRLLGPREPLSARTPGSLLEAWREAVVALILLLSCHVGHPRGTHTTNQNKARQCQFTPPVH